MRMYCSQISKAVEKIIECRGHLLVVLMMEKIDGSGLIITGGMGQVRLRRVKTVKMMKLYPRIVRTMRPVRDLVTLYFFGDKKL